MLNSFRYLLLLGVLFIGSCSTSSNVGTVNLKVDPEGAVSALRLIEYLSHATSLNADEIRELDSVQIDSLVQKNRDDEKLSALIDELLSTDVYDELAEKMKSYEKGNELEGKDAYREAFTRMPYRRTRLTAGVDGNFMALISSYSGQFEKKSNALIQLFNTPEFAHRIVARTGEWLPDTIFNSAAGEVTIYLYFDGNRGHFQSGNSIYFDLWGERDFLTEQDSLITEFVEDVVAHELHHYLYGNWLKENTDIGSVTARLDDSRRLLLRWQRGILLEGSAHFCNWRAKPEFAQEMYLDNELAAQVFGVWDSVSNGIKNENISEEEFNKLCQELEHEQASDWLREYLWTNFPEAEAEQLYNRYRRERPVLHYLVGIKILREIYKEHGKEALVGLLAKPENLLSEYDKLTAVDKELPELTPEFISLWSEML